MDVRSSVGVEARFLFVPLLSLVEVSGLPDVDRRPDSRFRLFCIDVVAGNFRRKRLSTRIDVMGVLGTGGTGPDDWSWLIHDNFT